MENIIETSYREKELQHAQKFQKNSMPENWDSIVEITYEMIIEHQEDLDESILKDKQRLLGKELYDEFVFLLKQIIETNNKYVGQKVFDVIVKVNTNQEIISLREELLKTIEIYCKKRINKANSKDKNLNDKALRLMSELLPNLVIFMGKSYTLNAYLLSESLRYIYLFFQENIFGIVLNKEYYSNELEFGIITFYKCLKQEEHQNSIDIKDVKKKLTSLSENILKMKDYFLDKQLLPFELKCNNQKLILSIEWLSINHNIMRIHFLDTHSIDINTNGILVDSNNRLSNIEKVYENTQERIYLEINLYLVEKIDEYLELKYDKIEVNNLENELILSELKEEKFIEKKNENFIEEVLSSTSLKKYKIKENTSWQSFLKILKENFDVVVKEGKGDDIKILRQNNDDDNAKIYRTADIKAKKREILIKTQENILKKIGISPEEWNEIVK
jgi:hypothetical protein